MNFLLEDLKEEYIEPFLCWRLEPNTLRYNPVNRSTSEHLLREKLLGSAKNFSELSEDRLIRYFATCDGVLVGSIGVTVFNAMMNTIEIGYFVAQDQQGKGFGYLMLKAFVDKVFNESAIRKIIAIVAEPNQASWRILERTGFVREGLLREHYLIEKVPTNEFIYGLLRSDWKAN